MNKFKDIKKASIFGMIGNLFLMIIKGIIGFITNSQSMIADCMNSCGDIFSSIMTFVGNKIASKPNDEDHNLGHGKAEYIYSMLISIVMIFVAYKVFKDCAIALYNGKTFNFSIWLVVVCIITILIKLCLHIYTKILYKKYNNLLLKANSDDHRNDCIVTSVNLISCVCSLFGIYFIDGIVGILISIWIFIGGVKIFIESYNVLMDKSISKATKMEVYKIVEKYSDIKKITHFNSTPVGYQYQISFTVFVDGNMSTFDSHNIADKLEKEIDEKIDEIYLTVIHVNPMEINE